MCLNRCCERYCRRTGYLDCHFVWSGLCIFQVLCVKSDHLMSVLAKLRVCLVYTPFGGFRGQNIRTQPKFERCLIWVMGNMVIWGWWEDLVSGSSVIAIVLDCGAEAWAQFVYEAYWLPVILHHYHHIWSQAVSNDQRNNVAGTSDGNEVPSLSLFSMTQWSWESSHDPPPEGFHRHAPLDGETRSGPHGKTMSPWCIWEALRRCWNLWLWKEKSVLTSTAYCQPDAFWEKQNEQATRLPSKDETNSKGKK